MQKKKKFNIRRHATRQLAEFNNKRDPSLKRLRQLVSNHTSDLGGDGFISHSDEVPRAPCGDAHLAA